MTTTKHWLRLLLLLCLLFVLVGTGKVGFDTWQVQLGQRAIERVYAVRGSVSKDVTFDVQIGTISYSYDGISPKPLTQIPFITRGRDPCKVDISGCDVALEDATAIYRIPQCEILLLHGASISQDALCILASMPELRIIDLRGVAVSGSVFDVLQGSHNVTALVVSGDRVDARSLAKFRKERPACEVLVSRELSEK